MRFDFKLDNAIKHCRLNPNTSLPEWSKTNFSLCLLPEENPQEELELNYLEVCLFPVFITKVQISFKKLTFLIN